jgi:hypothetical protein
VSTKCVGAVCSQSVVFPLGRAPCVCQCSQSVVFPLGRAQRRRGGEHQMRGCWGLASQSSFRWGGPWGKPSGAGADAGRAGAGPVEEGRQALGTGA